MRGRSNQSVISIPMLVQEIWLRFLFNNDLIWGLRQACLVRTELDWAWGEKYLKAKVWPWANSTPETSSIRTSGTWAVPAYLKILTACPLKWPCIHWKHEVLSFLDNIYTFSSVPLLKQDREMEVSFHLVLVFSQVRWIALPPGVTVWCVLTWR